MVKEVNNVRRTLVAVVLVGVIAVTGCQRVPSVDPDRVMRPIHRECAYPRPYPPTVACPR